MNKICIATSLMTLFGSFSLFADVSQGETLEIQMWEDMKHRNYSAVENNIAQGFQSIHTDGARAREDEIRLIKDLYLGSYKITDIKVTEAKDSYIVTYMISVSETIDDTRLSANPTPRMSVWEKIEDKWQWISHANLNPIDVKKKILVKAATDAKK
ncbi:MAG: nuclear transport factor 2 family protein [Parachlamydiaceae bacterium]|nr:nuclear transport factor 2 family protein [Parachlamydiaceae bacterium]